jgi:hypothetical protein
MILVIVVAAAAAVVVLVVVAVVAALPHIFFLRQAGRPVIPSVGRQVGR